MTTHTSKACCERPVAVAANYTPSGKYEEIASTKFYITGSSTAKKAIFFMYDVFGYTPQTLQGADILATKGLEPYLVIIPDLLDGKPAQPAWFMDPEAEENKAPMAKFMARLQDGEGHVKRVLDLAGAAREKYPSAEKWGAIGCEYDNVS